MANTSDIRNGLCINYNNDVYKVVEFLHVKPGKGPAFVRTKLKSLTNGKVLDNTFPAGHKIDVVRVERRNFQFLYKDGPDFHFMDNETYEQTMIDENMIENGDLLKDGEVVEILFHAADETPLTIDLPQHIVLEVTYTEPGVRGDTATNVTKPATVETGAEIKVPIFINEGDNIKNRYKNALIFGACKIKLMTYKEIQDLLKLVSKSDLAEVRLKDNDFELTIRTKNYTKKAVQSAPVVASPVVSAPTPAPAPADLPTPAKAAAPASQAEAPAEDTSNLVEVKSPIVGTFYRSASPDKPPFVSVGDSISEGSVVCIIEAMKLFNEIESEVSGKIVKVLVDDASPVEYDQVLFLVDPKG